MTIMFMLNGKPLPLDIPFVIERDPALIEHPEERVEIEETVEVGRDTKGDPILETRTRVEVRPAWIEEVPNSVQFPANWLRLSTPEEREALGITEIVPQSRPDDALYFVHDNGDGTYTATEKPIEMLRELWLARIASRRWSAEVAGVMVSNHRFASDGASQGKLTAAVLAAVLDENYTVQWKVGGGFATLDKNALVAAAQAVRAHVQACFDREAELAEEVALADSLADLQSIAVDDGWPG